MYEFRPAVRTQSSLLIALAGASGGGKTYSALRLARGLVGKAGKIALIDTEAGRSQDYADLFEFDRVDMLAPFRPDNYLAAVKAAEKAGYGAIIVDSMSHEWSGEGGILDWQEQEFQRLGGKDSSKMVSWIKPKMAHKAMVGKMLQVRAHLIFCLRAEEKTKMEKDAKTGKMLIIPQGYQPICEKSWMFEMTISAMLHPNEDGVPHPIKLQQQHRFAFPDGQSITEKTGEALAEWASGGKAVVAEKETTEPAPEPVDDTGADWVDLAVEEINNLDLDTLGVWWRMNQPGIVRLTPKLKAQVTAAKDARKAQLGEG